MQGLQNCNHNLLNARNGTKLVSIRLLSHGSATECRQESHFFKTFWSMKESRKAIRLWFHKRAPCQGAPQNKSVLPRVLTTLLRPDHSGVHLKSALFIPWPDPIWG